MPSKWRIEVENWLSQIEVSGSVLDVGGAEKPVRGRTKTWTDREYTILDLPNFDLSKRDMYMMEYDNVFCLETVMYTVDPVNAIKNLVSFTKKNLYISNPLEAYGQTKPEETDMHRIFPNWWKYWLNHLGMEIQELKIVYPREEKSRSALLYASRVEGYKMIRPHASGILIHAKKI